MLRDLKSSILTLVLLAWSTLVLAQTSPGSPGASSPSGTTTGANPGGAGGEGLNWLWIAIAVVVVAGLLFYFFGRRRTDTRL